MIYHIGALYVTVNRIFTFGRHFPVIMFEGTPFGGCLADSQFLSIYLNGLGYHTLELRPVMMHIIV